MSLLHEEDGPCRHVRWAGFQLACEGRLSLEGRAWSWVGLLCFGRGCSSHKIPDVQSPLPVDRGALHLEYKAGESYAEKESPPSFCFLALFFRAAAAHVALLIF
jgi:hypothetical protein